jgi:hypothetical protein
VNTIKAAIKEAGEFINQESLDGKNGYRYSMKTISDIDIVPSENDISKNDTPSKNDTGLYQKLTPTISKNDTGTRLPKEERNKEEEKEDKKDPPTPRRDLVEEIIAAWNDTFEEKRVIERNQSIRKKLTKQLKNPEFRDVWPDALKAAGESAYLTGESWFNLAWFCGNGKAGNLPGYMRCLMHEFAWKDGHNSNGHGPTRPPQETAAEKAARIRLMAKEQT